MRSLEGSIPIVVLALGMATAASAGSPPVDQANAEPPTARVKSCKGKVACDGERTGRREVAPAPGIPGGVARLERLKRRAAGVPYGPDDPSDDSPR